MTGSSHSLNYAFNAFYEALIIFLSELGNYFFSLSVTLWLKVEPLSLPGLETTLTKQKPKISGVGLQN